MFKFFDFAADAQEVIDVIVPIEEAGFFIVVDVEFFGVAGRGQADGLGGQIDCDDGLRIFFDGGEDFLKEGIADSDGEQEVVERVILKDVGEEAADHDVESGVFDGPGGMFAARSATEVLAAHKDFSVVDGVIEDKILFGGVVAVIAPVAEQVIAESVAAGGLEEAGGDDLIGIDVLQVRGNGGGGYFVDGFAHFFVLMFCRFFGDGLMVR